jgi:hypothetical protein
MSEIDWQHAIAITIGALLCALLFSALTRR